MARGSGTVVVKFLGDSKDLSGEIDRVESKLGKFGGAFKGLATVAAGAFAAAGAAQFLKGAFSEAQEAAKISRLTEAVVKSTGGAANVSADQLGKLSERLSNVAAVDDEVIQSAGNVLLTFTKVRNEVGKGNDIFDRTTEAALNMSAALGTDLQGATMQLGKALNDPIKGLTALGRAGVSFTAQQKEQVKAMVAAGDTLGAQKIILKEMETQFGGAAAAAADPMARLGVIVGNLQESVGTALLPVVEKASVWLGENLPKAVDFMGRAFGKAREFVQPLIDLVGNVVQVFQGGGDHGAGLIVAIGGFFGLMEDDSRLEPFFTAMEKVENVLGRVGSFLADNWKPILIGAGIATAALAAPLATLAAGVVYAYTQFEGFRKVVDAVGRFLSDTVAPAIGAFAGYLTDQFGRAVQWVQTMWPQISEAVGHVMNVAQKAVEVALSAIHAAWRLVGDDVVRYVGTAFGFIQATVENVMAFIQNIIKIGLAVINGDWSKAWEGVKGAAFAVWEQIKNTVTTAIGLVRSTLGAGMSVIGRAWSTGLDALKTATGAAVRGVVDWFSNLPGLIGDALGAGVQRLVGLGEAIVRRIIEGIKKVGGGIGDAILNTIPGGGMIRAAVSVIGGDGPGRGVGGTALATVQQAMKGIPGLYVTSTYRTPAENARVGGSPTSFHLDKSNPATDVGGSMAGLDSLYARLSRIGGRELLWRTKGHWDHLHYAHQGEAIGPGSPGWMPGLKSDERLRVVQVGETIVARAANDIRFRNAVVGAGASAAAGAGFGRGMETAEGLALLRQMGETYADVAFAVDEATAKTLLNLGLTVEEYQATARQVIDLNSQMMRAAEERAQQEAARNEEISRNAREMWFAGSPYERQIQMLEEWISAEVMYTDEWIRLVELRDQIMDDQVAKGQDRERELRDRAAEIGQRATSRIAARRRIAANQAAVVHEAVYAPQINVYDQSGDPTRTARETALMLQVAR